MSGKKTAEAFVLGETTFHAQDGFRFSACGNQRLVHHGRKFESDSDMLAWVRVERSTQSYVAYFRDADAMRAAIAEMQAALVVMEAEPVPCPGPVSCYRCKPG